MTMSISSAPAATASAVSASLTPSGTCPDGNAVATLATWIPDPATCATAVGTMDGYTQTAATDGAGLLVSPGVEKPVSASGCRAFAHNARTLPSVSAPSS